MLLKYCSVQKKDRLSEDSKRRFSWFTALFLQLNRRRRNRCSPNVDLVEVTGIEPVSESALTETSPGAVGHLHSLILPQADKLQDSVAS